MVNKIVSHYIHAKQPTSETNQMSIDCNSIYYLFTIACKLENNLTFDLQTIVN